MDSWSESEKSDSDINPDDDYLPRRRSERIANKFTEPISSDGSSDHEEVVHVAKPRPITVTPTRKLATTVKRKKQQPKGRKGKRNKESVASMNKQGMLNKSKRAVIIKSIRDIPLDTIVQHVEAQLYKEHDCSKETQKNILDDLVSNTNLFPSLIEHHRTTFICVYDQNSTGKEKYLKFQMEWHAHCSIFLLPKHLGIERVLSKPTTVLSDIRCSWLDFCDNHLTELETCNKIMICLSSSVYTILLDHIHSCTINQSVSAASLTQCVDGDDVQFRFGGAVLSDMLHLRYKTIRTCHESKREVISQEIGILQAINTREKSSMPSYLKYRDQGHMYTPHPDFISFFRDVDHCVKEVVTAKGFQEHGDQIVKIAHSLVDERKNLKENFTQVLRGKISTDNNLYSDAEENVYKEMVRKLCNIRIEEFLSSKRQKMASEKGHASTIGQNLRDTLLTHHTNLQSRIKIDT